MAEAQSPRCTSQDTVNRANLIDGNTIMSNWCSKILQAPALTYNEDLTYAEVGKDISCNLGRCNIATAMESEDAVTIVQTAIRGRCSIPIDLSPHPAPTDVPRGPGHTNWHGYLAKEHILTELVQEGLWHFRHVLLRW
ncbi:hypothetical protein QJS66_01990 [Kocuria rhizophila]|nr:hypothetical protein QJS66_01990 [Kocuria rhizophila]